MNRSAISVAQTYLATGQLEKAYDIAVNLLQRNQADVAALLVLSDVYQRLGRPDRALDAARAAFSVNPQAPEVRVQLAWLLALSNQFAEAMAIGELEVDKHASQDVWRKLVHVWGRLENFAKVLAITEQGLELWPDDEVLWHERANALRFIGRQTEAAEAYWFLIERNKAALSVYYALADMGHTDDERLRQCLKRKLNETDDTLTKIYCHHALYKVLERLNCDHDAITHLQHGNALQKTRLGFQISMEEKRLSACEQLLMETQPRPAASSSDKKTIFVVGMPRTGTTLVDRIISSHPQVTSVGESQQLALSVKRVAGTTTPEIIEPATLSLAQQRIESVYQQYLKAVTPLSGETPYVLDSMPMNFYFIPLLMAVPQAKVICLVRNGMDACFGNFRQLFAPNLPYYGYSYDQEDVAAFYVLFRRFLRSVQDKYPENVMILSYEALAMDPEPEIRRLIDFCDLPWHPGCLTFYKNPTAVATASTEQVRSPISTRHIGRWRRYATHLEPMLAALRSADLDEEEIVGPRVAKQRP